MRARSPVLLAAALAVFAGACASRWKPAFDEKAKPGLFESVAIAEPDEALTFARVEASSRDGGSAGESGGPGEVTRRVIAVTEYRDGTVRGVDLSTALGRSVGDPISVFRELGYDRLLALVRAAPESASVSVPTASLVLPVDLGEHHVAAATNFAEHAGDAGVETPFLFAKIVRPTGPYDAVPASPGLLDYEVEVAWVTLEPAAEGEAPATMGLVLANDLTDRETLMRRIDPWDIESGTGFTTGKSFPGYLPVGNLFVVPRDHRGFAKDLELELYVNDGLRQRAKASEMIWDIDEIFRRSWAWKDRRWDHRGTQVGLMEDPKVIPERTLILSGTPHGTAFDGLEARHYASGVTRWLLGGWSESVPYNVVSAYIDEARTSGAYLEPGDRVAIHVDRLGVLQNQVGP